MSSLKRKMRRQVAVPDLATVAFYGPDDRTPTKVAVGIADGRTSKIRSMRRWVAADLMTNRRIWDEVVAFIEGFGVRKVVETNGILGCPHEEGEDYPLGADCPFCPFWAGGGVKRWVTGNPIEQTWESWKRAVERRGGH